MEHGVYQETKVKKRIIMAFPYAGGSSMMYTRWKRKSEQVDMQAIDYAGHGFRYQEKLNSSFDELMNDVYEHVMSNITNYEEVFLFGHSMGGLVAYKVAEKLETENVSIRKQLLVSGSLPPEYYPTSAIKRMQGDEAVSDYIVEYNRISEKKIKTDVFKKLIFPAIRNDFAILNNYSESKNTKIDMPITCFFSECDSLMDYQHMKAWNEHSDCVRFVEMQGDHFFIEEDVERNRILGILYGPYG